ncbi:DUF2924 domain-containing protein [Asticcacaulis tiandongensis]|uniref:DUF2924 domain-containing protein n=1 Tax=Asticcacaulis tiandongensis TaxID=2565365 RepID=UPI001C643F2A|nr:DUF2924 domain-containing protein [Asticcacaulis tiandongensis]
MNQITTTKSMGPEPKPHLQSELARLEDLDDRSELLALWATHYEGVTPPHNIRNGLLRRAIAYRLQEQALGGLKPAQRRMLEAVAAGEGEATLRAPPPALTVKPGTRLVREWHGRIYEVQVLVDGVQLNGQTYRSLSDVARAITGVRWSGPRFFGLMAATAPSVSPDSSSGEAEA